MQAPTLTKRQIMSARLHSGDPDRDSTLGDWADDQEPQDWADEIAEVMTDSIYCLAHIKESASEFGYANHWFVDLPAEHIVRALIVDLASVQLMFKGEFNECLEDIKHEALGVFEDLKQDAVENSLRNPFFMEPA